MRKTPLLILFMLLAQGLWAQEKPIADIVVESGDRARMNTPIFVSLEGLALHSESSDLALFEINGKTKVRKTTQVEPGVPYKLWWILDGTTEAGKKRKFQLFLVPKDTIGHPAVVKADKKDGGLVFSIGNRNVLNYQYKPIPAPPGTSELFTRGGFIHPLWSPEGEILTRVQPPDHHHHVGIWNPWTETEFQGRELDFWNLIKGQGTVKFKTFTEIVSDDVFGEFKAVQDHVDLTAPTPTGSEVALKETWDVRVYNLGEQPEKFWMIDFISALNCATDSAFTIKKYRYEGFGFRATAKWNDSNCHLLTSEGKDKSNGNATRARWCDVRGPSIAGTSGILFMTNPSNFNYPEQLRIWPTGTNGGKENVFFNFNPTQDRDWKLEPGKPYMLQYRMFVYDGSISTDKAEQLWYDFAFPPRAELTPIWK